jgi:hypothetical protein
MINIKKYLYLTDFTSTYKRDINFGREAAKRYIVNAKILTINYRLEILSMYKYLASSLLFFSVNL